MPERGDRARSARRRTPDVTLLDEHRGPRALLRSVVKVQTVSDAPDYEQPWQTQGATHSHGSGVVIDSGRGLRVLTNAHVVENQVFVEVRRYGRSHKVVAEVEGLGHHCDLALLRVDDEHFFEGAEPVRIGGLPDLGDRVSVLGYPIGGERLSVTEGIVSRIEMSAYAQSQRQLLAVQIDAAINSGNSGGPVVRDGRLVGVAFQALEDAENVGYMIAAPVVHHFLRDVADGIADGFPDLGLQVQRLENRAHRDALGLPRRERDGVLVTGLQAGGSSWGHLQRGDVLLEIDGTPVGADGTVAFRGGERIDLGFVVTRRQVGEHVDLVVFREGQRRRIRLRLRAPVSLVGEERFDARPRYRVFGGLLFVPLTRNYLMTWGTEWAQSAPAPLLHELQSGLRTPERTEVVVLQKVLADRTNQGYHELESQIVRAVDGQRVPDFAWLSAYLDEARGPYVRFELGEGSEIVLDIAEARRRGPEILDRYGVPRDRSHDPIEADTRAAG